MISPWSEETVLLFCLFFILPQSYHKISLRSDPFLMKDISHYIVPLSHPPLTLVHHLSHHLSICLTTWVFVSLNFFFSFFWAVISQETLFRGLLHINAAIKVHTMHLMWWWQLFYRYFGVFLLPSVSVRRLYVVGTSWRIIIMVRVNNWTVFNTSEEECLLRKLPSYFSRPKP